MEKGKALAQGTRIHRHINTQQAEMNENYKYEIITEQMPGHVIEHILGIFKGSEYETAICNKENIKEGVKTVYVNMLDDDFPMEVGIRTNKDRYYIIVLDSNILGDGYVGGAYKTKMEMLSDLITLKDESKVFAIYRRTC